jgi:TP901 family phage tail tape measure protein
MATVIGDLFVRLGVDATGLSRDLSSAEGRLEKFGTQMFFLGSRITAGVSLPMGAALGVVTKFGMGFDTAMTESLAIMSTVDRQMRPQMEGVAKAISETTKFSATEGAEGFYHLASAGLDAATAMGALPIAARFAQAGVMNLEKATEFLATAQAAMSDGTESSAEKVAQMARVADVLTLANNRAIGTIQDFAEALTNKAGAALRQTHKDVEEGVAVLAAYAEQGIKGKAAGQQLWMVIRDLGTYALKNSDAFRKFGIAVYDSSGKMRNMADIIADIEKATLKMSDAQRSDMFIQLGIPLRSVAATKALLGYSDAIRDHEKALRAAGGTTKEVADNQMAAMSNQVAILEHEFQNAAIGIFQAFVPTIRNFVIPAAQEVLSTFKGVGEFIGRLPEPVKAIGLAFAGAAIAAGPLIAFLGSMSLLTGASLRGLAALTGGIASLSGGMSASTVAANTMAAGQSAVNIALGLTSTSMNATVLTGAALRTAQDTVTRAAEAGAKAMGMNAAAIANAGLEAKILLTNQNRLAAGQAAVNAVMAESAAGTGLWASAMGFLMNPITLVIGGLAALAAGYFLYQKSQEASYQGMIDNAKSIKAEDDQLKSNLETFDTFHGKVIHGASAMAQYSVAVDGLAKASGLSREEFIKETTASDDLTKGLHEQLAAQKELWDFITNKQRNATSDATNAALALERQLAELKRGGGVVTVETAEGGFATMKMGREALLEKESQLVKDIADAWKAAGVEKSRYANMVGGGKDTNLGLSGDTTQIGGIAGKNFIKGLGKEEIKRRYDAAVAEVRAAGGDTTALATAWHDLLYPKVTQGGMPEENQTERKKTAIRDLRNEWLGGGKDMEKFTAAWATLNDVEKADPMTRQRIWESYDKLRHAVGEGIPELDAFFAAEVAQSDAALKGKYATKDWADTLSDAASSIVADSDNMNVSIFKLNKTNSPAFWKANASAIEELIPLYDKMPPSVQAIIAAFQRFEMQKGRARH